MMMIMTIVMMMMTAANIYLGLTQVEFFYSLYVLSVITYLYNIVTSLSFYTFIYMYITFNLTFYLDSSEPSQ